MLPASMPIWVACGPVDLHWSFDRLIGIVRNQLGGDPGRGLFVFLNRRAVRAKVLFHDGTGWCVLYKRLDRGTFPLPATLETGAVSVRISLRELELMLLGRDLPSQRRTHLPEAQKDTPTVH
jgi:transposase